LWYITIYYLLWTLLDKPGTPANLRVTDTNKDHISIAWDAPESDGGSDITNYLIESRSDLDLGYVPIAKVDSAITNYTARGLLDGSDYNFRVKARNAAGVSEEGVELSKPVTAKLPFGEWADDVFTFCLVIQAHRPITDFRTCISYNKDDVVEFFEADDDDVDNNSINNNNNKLRGMFNKITIWSLFSNNRLW